MSSYILEKYLGLPSVSGYVLSSTTLGVRTWIAPGGGGGAWGTITGTLSDQLDLQAALDLKAPLASPTFTGVVTVPDASFALAKLANMATASLYYRKTAGAGAPEVNTLATLKTDLLLTGTNSGDQTSIVGITGTTAQFNTALTDNDFATLAGVEALSNKDLTAGTNSFPTLNQNTTGSAAKWTTARLLAGNSVDGSANATFANKFIVQGTADTGLTAAQFLGALGSGLVVNTTTTGVLSIAVSGTDVKTINGSSILGSGDLTVTGTAPDISLSILAPAVDETITAGYSAVLVRTYKIASGKKLTVGLAGRFRIL